MIAIKEVGVAVSWPQVGKIAAFYPGFGFFHYLFRRPFLTISLNHPRAETEGLNVRLWGFVFYASFGFVVTSSVLIAGVLAVFCYLIVPSVAAVLCSDRIGPRLAIGYHGHRALRPGHLSLGEVGPAHGRGHGLHLRPGPRVMALARPLVRRGPAAASV